MGELNSFRDLRVYQGLKKLHLEVHALSMAFPKFEMYELGSQIRRSSNAAPAIVAEGWGSRHTNIYIEALNRSLGEIRETQHHLDVATEKGYFAPEIFGRLDAEYERCGRMLEALHQSLSKWQDSIRTGTVVRETNAGYLDKSSSEWDRLLHMTAQVEEQFA